MYGLVQDMRARLAAAFPQQAANSGSSSSSSSSGEDGPPIQVVGYGHLGDGNLHLNISGVLLMFDWAQRG